MIEALFEVFLDRGEDREPRIIASVVGAENAKATMYLLAAQTPGRYLVWNPSEGEVVAEIDTTSSSLDTTDLPRP